MFLQYELNTLAKISGTVGLIFLGYKLSTYRNITLQKVKKEEDKINEINKEYINVMQTLGNESLNICKDWTKTDCKCAKDIMPFLEKYTKINDELLKQAMGYSLDKPISNKDIMDFIKVQEYNTRVMYFWFDGVKKYDISLSKLNINVNDIKLFSTLHWAIEMTTNNYPVILCPQVKEAYDNNSNIYYPLPRLESDFCVYEWIMKYLSDTQIDKTEIDEYRIVFMREYPEMYKRILQRKEEN